MVNSWHKALPSKSLQPRSLLKVDVAGGAVLLARLEDGTLAASSVACPHEDADLSDGTIYLGAVECPRHRYLYDLRTGENRYPRNVFPGDLAARLEPLSFVPVKEEHGWIWIARREA